LADVGPLARRNGRELRALARLARDLPERARTVGMTTAEYRFDRRGTAAHPNAMQPPQLIALDGETGSQKRVVVTAAAGVGKCSGLTSDSSSGPRRNSRAMSSGSSSVFALTLADRVFASDRARPARVSTWNRWPPMRTTSSVGKLSYTLEMYTRKAL